MVCDGANPPKITEIETIPGDILRNQTPDAVSAPGSLIFQATACLFTRSSALATGGRDRTTSVTIPSIPR